MPQASSIYKRFHNESMLLTNGPILLPPGVKLPSKKTVLSLRGNVQNPHGKPPSLNITRRYPAMVFTYFCCDPDATFETLFEYNLVPLGPPALGTM